MRKTILLTVALCSCLVLLGLSSLVLRANAQDELTPTLINEEANSLEGEVIDEVSADDLGVSEPTLLPGSRFYFLKDWWRGVKTAFTFNQEEKAELKLQFASERLTEARELAKQNKAGAIEKAMEKYGQEIDQIKEIANKIKGNASTSEKISNFLDKYANQQVLHTEILNKLKEQVPESAYQKIEQAREQHLERFGEVMDKLETRQEKVQERIQNAVENAQEKIENFQNRKGEILEKIESKLPERIRFRIQGGQPGELLGGDKDEHGCIGSAGYTWCEAKEKCLRTWEEPCQAQEQEQEQNQGENTQNQEQNQNQTPGNQQGQGQGQNY